MFFKKTVDDIEIKNKNILLRVDYNVPIKDGIITDNNRILVTKSTINQLLNAGADKIVIVSHMGRPKGIDSKLSLRHVASELEKIINHSVQFVENWQQFNFAQSEKIVLLENLRFDEREKANDLEFAQQLVEKTRAEIFVQDGFAVCHRQSATTDAVTKILPSVASLRLQNEYQKIVEFIENPKKPVLAIIGGAKISDKIDFIQQIIKKVDYLVIGGAMANTFLLANGKNTGQSLVETDQIEIARKIQKLWLEQGKDAQNLILPFDVKVTSDLNTSQSETKQVDKVKNDEIIADIGLETTQKILDLIDQSVSIIWNGNLGYTENQVFAKSTKQIAEKLNNSQKAVLIGGGDTVGYVNQTLKQKQNQHMFLSTGGGAMLELIAYQKLPGVESLLDN